MVPCSAPVHEKCGAFFRAVRFAIAYVPPPRHSGSTLRACTRKLLRRQLSRQALRGGVADATSFYLYPARRPLRGVPQAERSRACI